MSKKELISIALLFICLFSYELGNAQEEVENDKAKKFYNNRFGSEIRGKNAVTIAGGTAVMNGDFLDPLFEIYFHAGYKRFLGSHVNLNFTYHKFNLAYKDQFNNGFMSFDLNLEVNLMPYDSFTPFLYVGGGLNAANYFTQSDAKIQGGAGIEYLVSNKVGIKLFANYNHVFSDELDGKIFGEAEDVYYRIGLGLNLYFGKHGKRNRITGDVPTVRESNPIVDDYK